MKYHIAIREIKKNKLDRQLGSAEQVPPVNCHLVFGCAPFLKP